MRLFWLSVCGLSRAFNWRRNSGAITYVSESIAEHKGLACGIIFCALTFGIVLGSIVHATIVSLFPPAEMQAYGWRIPFIAGGIFGLLSYFLRRNLHESSQFLAIENTVEKFPIITVFKQQLLFVFTGAFMIALCAVIVTALFLFMPAYFTKILHLPDNAYIWERTAAIACGSALSVLFGYMTDLINVKRLVLVLIFMTAGLAYPIFVIYGYHPELYALAFIASAFLLGFSAGIVPRLLSELFPTRIRYSGIAISYNLGFAFFGGLTPFISLSLIYYTGKVTMPALYLIVVSLLAIIFLSFVGHKVKIKMNR